MTKFANPNELLEREHILETELSPGGLLYAIGKSVVEHAGELAPLEIASIIKAPAKADYPIVRRWETIENTRPVLKAATEANRERVEDLADRLGMRHAESLRDDTLGAIDPDNSIWRVKSGARFTGVVRRQLGIDAMRRVYGSDVEAQALFQTGSVHVDIPRMIEAKEGGLIENPEYTIARKIADAEHLPAGDSLTQFGLNYASALSAGYHLVGGLDGMPGIETGYMLEGQKGAGLPRLFQLAPSIRFDRTEDGITAISGFVDPNDKQIVEVNNGQYGPIDQLMDWRWSEAHPERALLGAIAIGDEAGYTVHHRGEAIVTQKRVPTAYVNEMVSLYRMYMRPPATIEG